MKNAILSLAAFLTILTSHSQWQKIKGNGNITSISRVTSQYSKISCEGSFDYRLVRGNEGQLTLEGESNLLQYISTEVRNGQLVITTKKGKTIRPSRNKTIVITIPFQDIAMVSLSGSGNLWNEDTIASTNLEVELSGSGDVILDIQTQSVSGKVTGSGDLTLKGIATYLTAGVVGSGNFHGFDLKTKDTNVSVTGSGVAKVVSNGVLTARVVGSGDIEYRGNPTTKDTKVSGSGSIES